MTRPMALEGEGSNSFGITQIRGVGRIFQRVGGGEVRLVESGGTPQIVIGRFRRLL